MFKIIIYEDAHGHSELGEFLDDLTQSAPANKNARIQLKQIVAYVELLKTWGTRLPSSITKHLKDDLWELRPGSNRVLYFYFCDETFVLLHHFRKKTQKTPKSEIEKAEREMSDYKRRKGEH